MIDTLMLPRLSLFALLFAPTALAQGAPNLLKDLSAIGAVGNAAGASAEIGEAILDHAVGGLLDLLKDVEKHPGFAG